jgi:phosphate transport system protein
MIEYDHEINRQEVAIDELALNVIALRQPAARDLRFITLALKVSTDLERIGDSCVNIAERTLELNEEPQLKPYIDLPKMAEAAEGMISDSLEAFLRGDAALAEEVTRRDDTVDQLNEQVFRELLTFMMEDPRTISRATRLMFIGKYLERMGDHATNIAEMVIFMVRGKDIRHMGIADKP